MTVLRERWPEAYTVAELAEKSGISRGTMQYWEDHPDSPLAKPGRRHWERIFGTGESAPTGYRPQEHPRLELKTAEKAEPALSKEEEQALAKVLQQQTKLLAKIMDRLERLEKSSRGSSQADQPKTGTED